jgi:hypothetical protein
MCMKVLAPIHTVQCCHLKLHVVWILHIFLTSTPAICFIQIYIIQSTTYNEVLITERRIMAYPQGSKNNNNNLVYWQILLIFFVLFPAIIWYGFCIINVINIGWFFLNEQTMKYMYVRAVSHLPNPNNFVAKIIDDFNVGLVTSFHKKFHFILTIVTFSLISLQFNDPQVKSRT